MRSSSVTPSSNSWLPTLDTSSCIAFSDSTDGSSWKSPENAGDPPMRSPAATVRLYLLPCRSSLSLADRYSDPPAAAPSTVPGVSPLDVAVVVVDPEQLQIDQLPLRIVVAGRLRIAAGKDRPRPARRGADRNGDSTCDREDLAASLAASCWGWVGGHRVPLFSRWRSTPRLAGRPTVVSGLRDPVVQRPAERRATTG